jgi:hypothetical protein
MPRKSQRNKKTEKQTTTTTSKKYAKKQAAVKSKKQTAVRSKKKVNHSTPIIKSQLPTKTQRLDFFNNNSISQNNEERILIDHVNKKNNSTLFRDILALVETNLHNTCGKSVLTSYAFIKEKKNYTDIWYAVKKIKYGRNNNERSQLITFICGHQLSNKVYYINYFCHTTNISNYQIYKNGAEFLDKVIQDLVLSNYTHVALRAANPKLIKYYEKQGFERKSLNISDNNDNNNNNNKFKPIEGVDNNIIYTIPNKKTRCNIDDVYKEAELSYHDKNYDAQCWLEDGYFMIKQIDNKK